MRIKSKIRQKHNRKSFWICFQFFIQFQFHFQTVLSRARLSASKGVFGPTVLSSESLHLWTAVAGEEHEWKTRDAFLGLLTKWAVSPVESGERRIGIRPLRAVPEPLLLPQSPTGDPPEVNPSSAELRSPRSFLIMFVGLAMIRVQDEDELEPADESTDVFMREEGEIPPPEEEQLVNRGPCWCWCWWWGWVRREWSIRA